MVHEMMLEMFRNVNLIIINVETVTPDASGIWWQMTLVTQNVTMQIVITMG